MVDAALMEQAQRLGGAEKLEMIHALWDSIDHADRETSARTVELVRRRATDADAAPGDEITSEEFWAGIARRSA